MIVVPMDHPSDIRDRADGEPARDGGAKRARARAGVMAMPPWSDHPDALVDVPLAIALKGFAPAPPRWD